MDTVDPPTRSKIMARVGQKDTGVELILRRSLHKLGLRYKLHDKRLPGSPDIVFPRFKAAIFVNGCYWHAHGCHRSKVPKNRQEFWIDKFKANRARDERGYRALLDAGWRVMIVWECVLRGKTARSAGDVAVSVQQWLVAGTAFGQIGEEFSKTLEGVGEWQTHGLSISK